MDAHAGLDLNVHFSPKQMKLYLWIKGLLSYPFFYLCVISLPFTKLLERWSDDSFSADDTVSTYPNIGQISPNHTVCHNDTLKLAGHVAYLRYTVLLGQFGAKKGPIPNAKTCMLFPKRVCNI